MRGAECQSSHKTFRLLPNPPVSQRSLKSFIILRSPNPAPSSSSRSFTRHLDANSRPRAFPHATKQLHQALIVWPPLASPIPERMSGLRTELESNKARQGGAPNVSPVECIKGSAEGSRERPEESGG